MKKIFFIILIYPLTAFTQNQQRTLLFYNVGLGGITSGIGSIINKPKNTKWKKNFVKGFWQGTIGGFLNYESKKTLYLINSKNEYLYAWPAKILHAAALSIIENAALNEPFLENWNIDFGPVRFDFSINKNKSFKARLLPIAITSALSAGKAGKFDISKTLKTGNLIFVDHKNALVIYYGKKDVGYSFGRAIAVGSEWNESHWVMAHEIIHQFQFGDFQVFNTWLKPLEIKLKSKSLKTIFSKYVYLDIPYIWPLYESQGRYNYPHHYKNFFEFEAQRFSTNKYVQR